MKNALKYWFMIAGVCLLASCEDEGEDVSYNLPETYDFENINYSGQITRLDMMAEMTTYMKSGNEGAVLDAQKLKNMYANLNSPFESSELNTASKDLKSKTFELDQPMFESFIEALAEASTSTQEGSNGVAGVVISNDGSKKYLMDENGVEYTQVIEKGLMGAVFYYQATAVYFSEEKIGPTVDNSEVTEGEGTTMQHHWDEAFGYLGVPQDFPANTEDARFWGKYGNDRNDLLETNTIMDDFITGRAAIVNGDMDTKYEMISSIRNKWEMISAGTAIHYINSALNDFADDALRNHALSEAWAFVQSLKYNPDRQISLEQIEEVQQLLGTNFYEVSTAQLNNAKDLLAELYDMESIKNDL